MARVTAVDAAGWLSAVGTVFAGLAAVRLNVQCALGGNHRINGKAWQVEWNGVDGLATPR